MLVRTKAYEIPVAIAACQPDGVFTFPAPEFKHYRAVVVKIVLVPTATQREPLLLQYPERILEHTVKGLHLAKFLQFVLTHTIFQYRNCKFRKILAEWG